MSQYSALYCDRQGLVAWKVYCKIGWLLGGVSQYNLECCSLRQGCLCHKTGRCVSRQQGLGSWGAGHAAGAQARRGRAWGAQQERWKGAGRADGRRTARGARAAGAQSGRCTGGKSAGARDTCGRARVARAAGRAGRAAGALLGALGPRPGRTGWPWAVHSVHSARFRSDLTLYFS